ncbi:MAG TPA: D-hexose-6-phosphate mutarotase [Burkholderiales bacterium]|nr:D-hexose-6-phosphate mutarotase [Burkholderiales bacterium]
MPPSDLVPVPGVAGLPKLELVAGDGARAEVYLHGAHVTSWAPAGGGDRLFLSARSGFGPGEAIRGGIPVCFPQFAGQGPLPNHGFARVSVWELVHARRTGTGAAQALLRLGDSPVTRARWPHPFALELTVTVTGRVLELGLTVINAGTKAFEFTGALHTYLRVADVRHAVVRGLRNLRYRDKALGTDGSVETAQALAIDREIDRVYYAAPDDLAALEPGHTTAIRATGFPDTVVWNPGPERGATLGDLEPDGYLRMLCVEAAISRAPATVAPGARWTGSQTLIAR